ncbi:MAG: tRNA pseudouridine(13) synthase TruD, partial [Phycisphaeraceae bacterium]|nr:tRNA pseudouridine(13) synthase TruD [Phycisphaeraceae bacterium]
MLDVHPLAPPLMLTANLPGVGGRIKARPDDFRVDELPLTQPSGTGEHLWLTIEKRVQTTTDVARRIAKIFRVKPWHVSYAGLKDKYAVTRQVFSVHLPDASEDDRLLARFEFTPFTLRDVRRHTRKLRRGHLAGNHFDIRIRDLDPAVALAPAGRILDQLIQRGMPNYFGPQRFGYRLVNHELGRLLILRRYQELL